MTKQERKKLLKAIILFLEPDGWEEAMEILNRLYNSKWKPREETYRISSYDAYKSAIEFKEWGNDEI